MIRPQISSLPVLLFAFLCLAFNSVAQSPIFEISRQLVWDNEYRASHAGGDGSWYLAGYQNSHTSFQDFGFIEKLDSNGQHAWSYNILSGVNEIVFPNAIEVAENGDVIVGGWSMMGCDFFPDGQFLARYTKSGSKKFEKFYVNQPWGYTGFDDVFRELLVPANNKIYTSLDSVLVLFDSNGDSVAFDTLGLGMMNDLAEGFLGTVWAACDRGIVKCDSNAMTVSNFASSTPVMAIQKISNSEFLIVKSGKVYKIDSSLNYLDSLSLTLFVTAPQDIEPVATGYWINDANDAILIDASLNVIKSSKFTKPASFVTNTFSADDSRLLIAGESGFFDNQQLAARSLDYDGDGLVHGNDIGILSVDILNDSIVISPFHAIYLDIDVTVKNYGTETVKRFFINSHLYGIYICGDRTFMEQEVSVNIAPGDTHIIHIKDLYDFNVPKSTNPYHVYEACFWTSSPNDLIDQNYLNDSSCSIMDSLLSREIEEGLWAEVWPNPTSGELRIKTLLEIDRVQLFDLHGKLLHDESLRHQNWYQLEMASYEPGMYIVQISSGEYRSRKKVLKID